MLNLFLFLKNPSFILGFFSLALLNWSQQNAFQMIQAKPLFIAPPPHIERFVFDYNPVMADLLWLRTIQDLDHCENKDHLGRCRGNPWVYKMLESTTNLDPKYRIIYAAGGMVLSVLINDIKGATLLFNKGIQEYPKDWPILYRAGYHFLFEEDDQKKSAELFLRAAQNGAPDWLYSLSARLYTQSGATELANKIFEDLKQQGMGEHLIEQMRDRLHQKLQIPRVKVE